MLIQKDLESNYVGEDFVQLSISETIHKLCMMNEHKQAAKIRSEFKVPDKRYWWLRIKAHAKQGDWMGLDKFSKEKKSPIGYEPFAFVCLERGNSAEAHKYISKIANVPHRVNLLVRIGAIREAAEAAFKEKDGELMAMVRKSAKPDDQAFVDQLLSQSQ